MSRFMRASLCTGLVSASLACAGLAVSPTGVEYNPTPFQQLETSLQMLQAAKLQLLQDPDEFFAATPQAQGFTTQQVLSFINEEIRSVLELKKDIAGGSGSATGSAPSIPF